MGIRGSSSRHLDSVVVAVATLEDHRVQRKIISRIALE